MTTEHFVIKDGVLRWIKDMPNRDHFEKSGMANWASRFEAYKKEAIDNSIEVSNQEHVSIHLFMRYPEFPPGEEGRVYSLNCRVEVKPNLECDGDGDCKDVRGIYSCGRCYKEFALVTFPSENKELGEAERVESDLNEMFDTKRIIDFAVWYSGMDRSKVVSAYKRYINEKLSKPVTPTDNES